MISLQYVHFKVKLFYRKSDQCGLMMNALHTYLPFVPNDLLMESLTPERWGKHIVRSQSKKCLLFIGYFIVTCYLNFSKKVYCWGGGLWGKHNKKQVGAKFPRLITKSLYTSLKMWQRLILCLQKKPKGQKARKKCQLIGFQEKSHPTVTFSTVCITMPQMGWDGLMQYKSDSRW